MKRILPLLLVLLIAVGLAAQAEPLPQTITRSVPLEGTNEERTYTLVQDAQGRFSIYIDEGFYEAVQTDAGMIIQQKGGGATMTLTVVDGDPKKLREAAITPEIRNDDWEEDFDGTGEGCGATPFPGCSAVYTEGDRTRSLYWFDVGNGKVIVADYSLLPEEQEGHGVRMWDMLETLTV